MPAPNINNATKKTEVPRARRWALRLGAICFWLIVWQVAAAAIGSRIILVGPLEVLARLGELALDASFWRSIGISLARIALGFATATVAAVLLAAAASRARAVRELLAPLVGAVKAAPVASFVILLLIWVPSRNLSVMISFLMTFPIVYTNVLEGIDQTDPQLLQMADVFGVRGWDRVRTVYAAEVLPYLRAGLSLAVGLAWKSGIAAEVIGLPDPSIGVHLYDAKVYLDTPDLFAWTLAIVALSVAIEAVLGRALAAVERRWETRP